MVIRNNKTYYSKLTKNLSVWEFFVSRDFPKIAYKIFLTCKDHIFNNIKLLALIEQDVRDFANTGSSDYGIRIYNESAVRNKKLNKKVKGKKKSWHLKGMSVDFHLGEHNNYLEIIYDYLKTGIDDSLKPSQVILYKDKVTKKVKFIHITVPIPGIKQKAWIEFI